LKAKARWKRWEEELTLVKHEMGWTTCWFKHQKEIWERRSMESIKPGHRAYANQQALMWEKFVSEAETSFKEKMVIVT